MPRTLARACGVLAAAALTVLITLYAVLVLGSRPGVEYYYGR